MCVNSNLALFVFLSFLVHLSLGNGEQHTVPLKAYQFKHDFPMIPRSNAISKKTVVLKSGDSLTTPLCIRQDGIYRIAGVSYSNDGGTEVISVSLNSENIGSFISNEGRNDGTSWNIFHNSGPIGTSMNLKTGDYELSLHVDSSCLNVIEIDAIFIETTDMTGGAELLECKVRCLPVHRSVMDVGKPAILPMKIVQHSFKTKCAEQDNIDVPMYHENVNSYKVVASYPQYNFSFNTKHTIFENCETLSPSLLWRLKTKPFEPSQNVTTDLDSFDLNLVSGEPFTININFRLKGKANGLIDSDVGSVLKVSFQNVVTDFYVSCRYITREKVWSAPKFFSVSKGQQTFKCAVPDYSWTEHEINTIQLTLTPIYDETIKIDTMELTRRYEHGESIKLFYSDGEYRIEGRNVDFWWRRPRTMRVRIQDKTYEDVDFIVVYKRKPTTTSFNQVLVIYEDGNFRILPLSPTDIDWTPFGSSMIIGQSDPPGFRPVAEISFIDIITIEKDIVQLRLEYFDGGSALIKLTTPHLKTVLHVSELNFQRSLKDYPFARFRSMWVRDGNCDVDHLKVNGSQNIPILSDWKIFRGYVAEFFRLCESLHLNLSPDITLKLLS